MLNDKGFTLTYLNVHILGNVSQQREGLMNIPSIYLTNSYSVFINVQVLWKLH